MAHTTRDTLRRALRAFSAFVDTLRKRIEMSNPTIGQQLDNEITNLNTRVDNAFQGISDLNAAISNLEGTTGTEVQALKDRVSNLESGIQTLANDLTALEGQINQEVNINTQQATAIQQLQAQVAELQNIVMPMPEADVYVTVDRNAQGTPLNATWGITPIQNTLESWDNPTAVNRAIQLASGIVGSVNQHLMGWGAPNPWELSTGPITLGQLNAKFQRFRGIGKPLVLTACSAPDWMKGLQDGTTDWNVLGSSRPLPQFFDEFAMLVVEVLEANPDIYAVQVWNEMKGFWNLNLNRWNYEEYTQMYNAVYTAVKDFDPNILVGGPYMTMVTRSTSQQSNVLVPTGWIDKRHLDVVNYWNANKIGADFVCVDGGYRSKDTGQFPLPEGVTMFDATEYYAIVTDWLQQVTGLPVWWSEWYINAPENQLLADAYNAAIAATSMAHMAISGIAMSLRWGPENGSGFPETALWTNTEVSTGGEPMPFYTPIHRAFHEHFSVGKSLYPVTVDVSDLMVLASETATMLINQANVARTVAVGRDVYTLQPYETKVI